MTPQSLSKYVPWDLIQFSQSPSAAPSYFPKSHQRAEISSLEKVILFLGKNRSPRVPNLGCRGTELPTGNLMFCQKSLYKMWYMSTHVSHDEAASHQLSISAAFWITQIDSAEECLILTQNLMQICCSTCSIILNAMATQYTCSLNGTYHPDWLIQWSHHSSYVCILSTLLGCQITLMSHKLFSLY